MLPQAKVNCLNRDGVLTIKSTGSAVLQRHRKALLYDLSALVKLGKQLDADQKQADLPSYGEAEYSQLVMSAFKLLGRAVRFHDIWMQLIVLNHNENEKLPPASSRQSLSGEPLTPPAEPGVFAPAEECTNDGNFLEPDKQEKSHVCSRRLSETAKEYVGLRQAAPVRDKQETPEFQEDRVAALPSPLLPTCLQSGLQATQPGAQRSDLTLHRVSWLTKASNAYNSKLASHRLVAANDAFLSFLGIFLGVHLLTRTSTEILVNTQQSVNAGRSLLTVVEAVWERDSYQSKHLEECRDSMYLKITNLVHAAQHIFQPLENSTPTEEFNPAERNRLGDAAMSCVKGAGECVDATRTVLQLIGDFEFETVESRPTFTGVDFQSSQQFPQNHRSSVTAEHFPLPPDRESASPTNLSISQQPSMGASPLSAENSAVPLCNTPTDSSRTSIASNLPPPPSLTESTSSLEDLSPISMSSSFRIQDGQADATLPTDNRVAAYSIMSGSTSYSNLSNTLPVQSDDSRFTTSTLTLVDCKKDSSANDAALVHANSKQQEMEETEEELLSKTFAHELAFNKEGQITGGTLPALIERLTASDVAPDALFVSTFYLTFRSFSTAAEVAGALIERFRYSNQVKLTAGSVTLRIYNVFKNWLEAHWQNDLDESVIPMIESFAREELCHSQPGAAKRLLELCARVVETQSPVQPRKPRWLSNAFVNGNQASHCQLQAPKPFPVISKSQLGQLRAWKDGATAPSILDFEPLELARQLTLKASSFFCQIMPEELLGLEWTKKSGSIAHNVRAMSTLSTDITNLVADTVLHFDEHSKRAKIIKRWVKIAGKCLELDNYDSLMAIICSLNSTPILRLKRTWECVPSKVKASLEALKAVVDCSKNYTTLRQRLLSASAPCLPFVGMYLTDLTFVDAGNSCTRKLSTSSQDQPVVAINFDKHLRTARIISDVQRFQAPYLLQDVPELQAWLQEQFVRVRSSVDSGESPVNRLYRRSCLLEPREPASGRPNFTTSSSSGSQTPRLHRREGDFMGISWRPIL